ncbi:MAG: hypothetical protein H7Y86_21925 [Rhizobacter sp.]|nr:hypothetical protein [Ferruginibacter sp.]
MLRSIVCSICLLSTFIVNAKDILVKNIEELAKANKAAQPGDIVILQNGEWNNVSIELDCKGTAAQPIVFRAQIAGRVIIKGNSKLFVGGEYITVDGLYFTKGYAGKNAVIQFRSVNKEPANHCRVTNTIIDDFNNEKRLDDNNWVLFYGKYNRLDHSVLRNKKNIGVTLAVILEDERSRENFHSIDHNYFAFRIPLGSNGGETIRVGVSQHCEFASNTIIENNFFEHCDGETEIISIKSGSNIIRNNLFKESFGAVVLRHGDNNVVENNIFLGNNKVGTGGVRVINKGQWVVNNFFYQLTGSEFRSPLAVMNGVPNSPANRYVAAQNAVIANNTWYQCTPLGFCVGSDAERSQVPSNVLFLNNIVYGKTEKIYDVFDKMSGFHFTGNITGNATTQELNSGFIKMALKTIAHQKAQIPYAPAGVGSKVQDSLMSIAAIKLKSRMNSTPGFSGREVFYSVIKNAMLNCGTAWSAPEATSSHKLTITCKDAAQLADALTTTRADYTIIRLTGTSYEFTQPLEINRNIEITSSSKKIRFSSKEKHSHLFEVNGGGTLSLSNLNLDLAALHADNFIISDKDANTEHGNIRLTKNSFSNWKGIFFNASKTSQLDSMIVTQNIFTANKGILFSFTNEDDKKGYYNVERLFINNNKINGQQGQVLAMLRGGNDESTMGPMVWFNNNILTNCSAGDRPLIHYYGTQLSYEQNNKFSNSNTGGVLIKYEDVVKAVHVFKNNVLQNSGKIEANRFTEVHSK